jgi:hypothetical protein
MIPICHFVKTHTTAGKCFKDIQKIVKDVYGDKALKHKQIYNIVKKVKEGRLADKQAEYQKKEEKFCIFMRCCPQH